MMKWKFRRPRAPIPKATRRTIPVRTESSPTSACYAPHTSMYFDQFGKVRACCQNTGVYLGDVTEQSLREIWESTEAEQMRTALENNDYSSGCDFCEWQVREGNQKIVFARQFDELQPTDRRPRWPKQMEFSLTNTCNLACAMCNGDWSSTIRAKREGRPPIPVVYGEAFYEQLAEFLPHLEEVAFLGGEPFLGKEPLRIMEMLAELDEPPRVTITTNGTIYTDRVKRTIAQLRPYLVVSLDGASEATYDTIRVGAHFPDVLANIDRYRATLGPGYVSLAHCLMTSNWHEFADLLRLAAQRDMLVGVNVVRFPAEHSLYQLDAEDLAEVVAILQATNVADLEGRHLEMWTGHISALAHRLNVLRSGESPGTPARGLPGASMGPSKGPPGTPTDETPMPWAPFSAMGKPCNEPPLPVPSGATRFAIGSDGIIRLGYVDADESALLDGCEAQPVEALDRRLHDSFGQPADWLIEPSKAHGGDLIYIEATLGAGHPTLELTLAARRDDAGALRGAAYAMKVKQ